MDLSLLSDREKFRLHVGEALARVPVDYLAELEFIDKLGRQADFRSVRYMNDKGLKRKFDAEAYVKMRDTSRTAL